MKPKHSLLLVVVLYLAHLSGASAAFVNLDFQADINEGRLPLGTVVSDQYSDLGLSFQLANVLDPELPGPVADGFGTDDTRGLFTSFNPSRAILAVFDVPVRTVEVRSIELSPLSVRAFDTFGEQLGQGFTTGLTSVEIASDDDISFLWLINDSDTGFFGRSDLTIISAISFETVSSVPLPPAVVAFAGGLVLLTSFGALSRKG